MSNQNVVLVTGASKGIGLEIVLRALEEGHRVIGTSRNAASLREAVANRLPEKLETFTALEMSFNEESIKQTIDKVMSDFGQIDVLVNNAGYAILGAVEEFSLSEVKTNFEVNFFGLLNIIQEVLPHMRKQRSGHIINMSSISGTVTGPSQSIYSATKASVIMLSEALSEEVAPFGIKVTAICPGGVRTDFLDQSSMKRPEKHIADYDVVNQTMQGLSRLNHNQSGDPALVAKAIMEVAAMTEPPVRLYLGSGALGALEYKLNQVAQEANQYVGLSQSIDRR